MCECNKKHPQCKGARIRALELRMDELEAGKPPTFMADEVPTEASVAEQDPCMFVPLPDLLDALGMRSGTVEDAMTKISEVLERNHTMRTALALCELALCRAKDAVTDVLSGKL